MIPNVDFEENDEYRDRVATIDEKGKRKWVYAYKPTGRFYNARTWLSLFYLIVFFGLPWVTYKGEPFMLLNILERKFVVFGFVFWSQDFFLFGLTMILFVVFIIVFTVAFGRLFCGWACPQTVFMEMVFRRIEYWIEGDAPKQKALDKMPWNSEKIRKRGLKIVVFYAVAFLVGNTFLAYIIGVEDLKKIISEPVSQHIGGLLAMMVFSGVFFGVYMWFREQVCTVVCPYGRLQGVLMDRHSVVVAYDYIRGEPREKLRKNTERTAGDCIDCNHCVHVCPTGIDIRNGTQLECVHCTACIDACDSIMDRINKPKGLIKYASETTIADNKPFTITTRLKAYIVLLVALLGIWLAILTTRSTVDFQIRKAPGQLYTITPEGDKVFSIYTVLMINKSHKDFDSLTLKSDNPNYELEWVDRNNYRHLKKESVHNGTIFIRIQRNKIQNRKDEFQIHLYNGEHLLESENVVFLAPKPKK
jgi:cytochrome c oxidase accessory protein FixG